MPSWQPDAQLLSRTKCIYDLDVGENKASTFSLVCHKEHVKCLDHSFNRTCTTGAKQLVVQEALDTTLCLALSYSVWFTPQTSAKKHIALGGNQVTKNVFNTPNLCIKKARVFKSPLPGAEMITFLAPASMCPAASAYQTSIWLKMLSSKTSKFSAPERTMTINELGRGVFQTQRLGISSKPHPTDRTFSASTKIPVDSITYSTPISSNIFCYSYNLFIFRCKPITRPSMAKLLGPLGWLGCT